MEKKRTSATKCQPAVAFNQLLGGSAKTSPSSGGRSRFCDRLVTWRNGRFGRQDVESRKMLNPSVEFALDLPMYFGKPNMLVVY